MKYFKSISLLTFLALMLTSCASTRMATQQSKYEAELKRIVRTPLSVEEKIDAVAMVFDNVLEESMDYSARNTLRHINHFQQRNKASLNHIYGELEDEMKKMDTAEQINFTISIIKKPYIKTFMKIIPKVERKINRKLNQIAMFGRFLNILNPF